jgi:hypothetical protein
MWLSHEKDFWCAMPDSMLSMNVATDDESKSTEMPEAMHHSRYSHPAPGYWNDYSRDETKC